METEGLIRVSRIKVYSLLHHVVVVSDIDNVIVQPLSNKGYQNFKQIKSYLYENYSFTNQ